MYTVAYIFFEESPDSGDFEEEEFQGTDEVTEETEDNEEIEELTEGEGESEEEEEQDISNIESDTSFQADVLDALQNIEKMNYSLMLFLGFYVSFRLIRDLFGGIR